MSAVAPALPETQRRTRGHRFYPPKAVQRKVPALAASSVSAMAHLHYFTGGWDWYVTEMDPETGRCFGLVKSPMADEEWGYFDLPELEAIRPQGAVGGRLAWVVERDVHWTPVLASTL